MPAFFGGLLMTAGILIAVLSGLCSGVFLSQVVFPTLKGSSTGDVSQGVLLVLVFGGVPFLVGLGLFFIGRRMFRRRDQQPAGPPGDGPTRPT